MTREEAIEQLQDAKDGYKEYLTDEALDMAIKSLEQKSDAFWCEGCKEHDNEQHCCHRYTNFIRYSLNNNINAVLGDVKEGISHEIENLGVGSFYYHGLKYANEIIDKYIRKEVK